MAASEEKVLFCEYCVGIANAIILMLGNTVQKRFADDVGNALREQLSGSQIQGYGQRVLEQDLKYNAQNGKPWEELTNREHFCEMALTVLSKCLVVIFDTHLAGGLDACTRPLNDLVATIGQFLPSENQPEFGGDPEDVQRSAMNMARAIVKSSRSVDERMSEIRSLSSQMGEMLCRALHYFPQDELDV